MHVLESLEFIEPLWELYIEQLSVRSELKSLIYFVLIINLFNIIYTSML